MKTTDTDTPQPATDSDAPAVGCFDLLAISYAENRMKLKAIGDEIKNLFAKAQDRRKEELKEDKTLPKYADIDLSDARKWWLEQNVWEGWVAAVEVDEYTKDEMKLAILLDKKAAIRQEAGKIKRAIYNRGKSLLANVKNNRSPQKLCEPQTDDICKTAPSRERCAVGCFDLLGHIIRPSRM